MEQAEHSDPLIGAKVGNYEVRHKLGEGGMGSVYMAEHPLIGKKVALKVLHAEFSSNDDVVSRFFNEARAVNQIGNEHIVEIHDVGATRDGAHYFVMEYIHGRTLTELLRLERILPAPRVLHIAAQVASALESAHAVSIIHRDLKPDNIMLTTRMNDPDFVKVLDFGLAKMLAASNQQNLTAQGMMLGTPHYMAPESCSGQPVDHRADVYSFGVLLFQMLTGQVPFDAPYTGTVLVKHVNQPPPAPRGLNPEIPPSGEQIVLRCMAKPPEARFANMAELRRALLDPEAYLAGSPPVIPSSSPTNGFDRLATPLPVMPPNRTMQIAVPPGPLRRRWMIAMILGLAALTGAAIVLALTDGEPREFPSATVPTIQRQPMALMPFRDASPAPATLDPMSLDPRPQARTTLPGAPRQPADSANPAVSDQPDPTTVTITVVTEPSGAQIFDSGDVLLGVTPTDITLPGDGQEHLLVFRHPKAREHRKRIKTSGDTEIAVELEQR